MAQVKTKIAVVSSQCVACGCCIKVCPLKAISIFKGRYATIEENKCVGCGKCKAACPASVIAICSREEVGR